MAADLAGLVHLLDIAREEARATGGVINTGHLLLAAMRSGDRDVAESVAGLSMADVRAAANRTRTSGRPGLTRHARAVHTAVLSRCDWDRRTAPAVLLLLELGERRSLARRLLRG